MTTFRAPNSPLHRIGRLERDKRKKHSNGDWEPDDQPGPVTDVKLTFKVREKMERLEYKARVTFKGVGADFCAADPDFFVIELRPVKKSNTGSWVSPDNGQKWEPQDNEFRRRELYIVEDPDDLNEKVAVTFTYIEHPKKWYWQARARVIDRGRRKGEWSEWTEPLLPFEVAMPRPPEVTGIALDFSKHDRRHEPKTKCTVIFDEIGPWDILPGDPEKEDEEDKQDDVRNYQVQLARINPNIVDDPSKNKYRQIGRVREKFVPSKPEEDDRNDIVRVLFPNLVTKNWFQARVRAFDRFGRHGHWSGWSTIGSRTDKTEPPPPISFQFDVDGHNFILNWESPADPNDPGTEPKEPHPDVAYFQYQIADSGTFANIIKSDRYFIGTHKKIKVKKPRGNYWARVRSVDGSGNKSEWAGPKFQGTKIPPKPDNVPTVGFDRFESSGGHKFRALVRFRYAVDKYDEDDINYYVVQAQISSNKNMNDSDPSPRARVDDDDEPLAVFRKVKAKDWVRARYRAVDRMGRKSPWSNWSEKIQATDAIGPNPPQNVSRVKGVKTVGVAFDPPRSDFDVIGNDGLPIPDHKASHYIAELSTDRNFNTIVDRAQQQIANRILFRVPNPKSKYFTRVAAVDSEGNKSQWIYDGPYASNTQVPAPPSDLGQAQDLVIEDDIDEDAVGHTKIKVNALVADSVRTHIIQGAIIRTSGPNTNRVVLKDSKDGEADRIAWINKNNDPVGYMKTDLGDIYAGGDYAFEGLQFSNNKQTAPLSDRPGWARIYLQSGEIKVAIRRSDLGVDWKTLAFTTNSVPDHDHNYALPGHGHQGLDARITALEEKIKTKSDKGHGHGDHKHGINPGSGTNHAHGGFTDNANVS